MGEVAESSPGSRDRDLAPVAALFGDPARAAMLAALADGQALPAGELARRARVHPATATAHLRRLVEGGLVRVRVQGLHRYHELAGRQVAAVLEALAQLAGPALVRSLPEHRSATALAEARTCYWASTPTRSMRPDGSSLAAASTGPTGAPHLAGALPAAITDRLLTLGWLSRTAGRGLRVAADYEQHLDHWLPPAPDPAVVETAR